MYNVLTFLENSSLNYPDKTAVKDNNSFCHTKCPFSFYSVLYEYTPKQTIIIYKIIFI